MNKTNMTKLCIITFIALFLFSASSIGLSSNYRAVLAKTSNMAHQPITYMGDDEITLNNTNANVTSLNYAGYAAIRNAQNDFTDAYGTWHVPHIEGSGPHSAMDIWVGIGGAAPVDGNIIQVGIELKCDAGGCHYTSWIENYPAKQMYRGDVTACHYVTALVRQVDANTWHVFLGDDTINMTMINEDVNTASNPPNKRSAGWLVESHQGWDLPTFGTVTFRDCGASASGVAGGAEQSMGVLAPKKRNMGFQNNNNLRVSTSKVKPDGQSFDTTFITPISVEISSLNDTISVGQSVTFSSNVTGGVPPYTRQWYLNGNPVPGANQTSWTFTPPTDGIYYVWIYIVDNAMGSLNSTTATIAVTSIPVGGYSVLVNAALLVPYIGLASTIALVTAATAIYAKRIKSRKEKQ